MKKTIIFLCLVAFVFTLPLNAIAADTNGQNTNGQEIGNRVFNTVFTYAIMMPGFYICKAVNSNIFSHHIECGG